MAGAQPYIEEYAYDSHGNMIRMPQLQVMRWDFKDQLHQTQRQAISALDGDRIRHQGERTYYLYDYTGRRSRKITVGQNGSVVKERLYNGGFEVHRELDGSGSAITMERQSLHVMDDQNRVALVESYTKKDGAPGEQLIRYQFANHLGSACLELDEDAAVITYGEYYPYGNTSYQAGRSIRK